MKSIIKILLFSFGIIICGCLNKLDIKSDKKKSPDIPPINTFVLSIPALEIDTGKTEQQFSNRETAVSIISDWKSLIKNNIDAPYNYLLFAQNIPATPFDDETWMRETKFTSNHTIYNTKFYCTYEADSSVLWELFFSENNSKDYIILQGNNNKESSQGDWLFYKYVIVPIPILKVTWINTDTSFLKTYYNLYHNSNVGSYLSVNKLKKTNSNYNILIKYYNSKTQFTTKIELDSANYNGRISDSLTFKDSTWHYWGSDFTNQ